MTNGFKYKNEKEGIEVTFSNTVDMPSIEVFARHTDGLLKKIEQGMEAVAEIAVPDVYGFMFNKPTVRKASEIQAEYDKRPREKRSILIHDNPAGEHSSIFHCKGKMPLEKVLQLMNKEYGGFPNFESAHFHWGANPVAFGADKISDANVYFTNSYFDEIWDLYEKCEIMPELKKRGIEKFKQISVTTPESNNPLFLDLAKMIVPIMALNDKDYVVLINDPVAGNMVILTPSEFNALSKEDIIKHYQDLAVKRDEYMKSDEYKQGGELMNAFIQGLTGIGKKVLEEQANGSSQSFGVTAKKKPEDSQRRRF